MKAKRVNGIINAQLTNEVLKPCPFCGGIELELINTHTPYYWISCVCGAELSDDFVGSRKDTIKGHGESVQRVIEKWNTRV